MAFGHPRRRLPRGFVGSPSISQENPFRFTDGTARTPAVAGCLAIGMRALNAVPAVNDLPPGWVTLSTSR
jgi:4-hydroxy-tetrahydrodipicolinate reductase